MPAKSTISTETTFNLRPVFRLSAVAASPWAGQLPDGTGKGHKIKIICTCKHKIEIIYTAVAHLGSPNGIIERIVTIKPRFDPLELQDSFQIDFSGTFGDIDVATPETPTSSLRTILKFWVVC